MKQSDCELERDVVSAILHLREHGWAVVNDVIARYVFSQALLWTRSKCMRQWWNKVIELRPVLQGGV